MIKLNTSIKDIKNEAKSHLVDKTNVVIIIGFLFIFVSTTIPNLLFSITSNNQDVMSILNSNNFFKLIIIPLIYSVLTSGPITLGITICSLKLIKNDDLNGYTLFEGFSNFFKSVGLNLLITLIYMIPIIPAYILIILLLTFTIFTFLGLGSNIALDFDSIDYNQFAGIGLVLFVIIILLTIAIIYIYLRYSLSFFILADKSKIKLRHALKISSKMMKKNYMKCLLLYLSFLGWAILFFIISTSIAAIVISITSNSIIQSVVSLLLINVTFSFYIVHINSSVGVFYLKLKENLTLNNYEVTKNGDLIPKEGN